MGCIHTCQRQLLASHLQDKCQYTQASCSREGCESVLLRGDVAKHIEGCVNRMVECGGCGIKVRFNSLQSHYSDCSAKSVTCEFCSAELPRSDLTAHNNSCPDYIIPCVHASNGCPWTGPRHARSVAHLPACPYEAIKGFFTLNTARLSTLSQENIILRQKVESLESTVQALKREMAFAKAALGPWFQPDDHQNIARRHFPEVPIHGSIPPASALHPQQGYDVVLPPVEQLPSSSSGAPNDLAPYFPPETEQTHLPQQDWHHYDQAQHRTRTHRASASMSFIDINNPNSLPTPRYVSQSVVAPVNLSTTLEGSLNSLRDSIVTLAASVDSLARRHEIALTNESLRLNEEVLALRVNMNGLRMQVHAIMVDRNAQVTGRQNEPNHLFEGGWVSPIRMHPPQMFNPSAPSITKL
jgi:hypothetical protein